MTKSDIIFGDQKLKAVDTRLRVDYEKRIRDSWRMFSFFFNEKGGQLLMFIAKLNCALLETPP